MLPTPIPPLSNNIYPLHQVEEVREMLWKHVFPIFGAFDYYAVCYSEYENAAGEPDIFNSAYSLIRTSSIVSTRE